MLKIKDIMNELGVTRAAIQHQIDAGRLVTTQRADDGDHLITRADYEAWLKIRRGAGRPAKVTYEQIKALKDQRIPQVEIARRLDIDPSHVSRLLKKGAS